MVDLVQWLTAQLDADAEANASPYAEGAWHTRGCASIPDVFGQETSACDCGVPARVLREIDAKRQLVKLHGRATLRAGGGAQYYATTAVCRSCEPNLQFPEESWPCSTLRLLASVYADRPGFREEWSP